MTQDKKNPAKIKSKWWILKKKKKKKKQVIITEDNVRQVFASCVRGYLKLALPVKATGANKSVLWYVPSWMRLFARCLCQNVANIGAWERIVLVMYSYTSMRIYSYLHVNLCTYILYFFLLVCFAFLVLYVLKLALQQVGEINHIHTYIRLRLYQSETADFLPNGICKKSLDIAFM